MAYLVRRGTGGILGKMDAQEKMAKKVKKVKWG